MFKSISGYIVCATVLCALFAMRATALRAASIESNRKACSALAAPNVIAVEEDRARILKASLIEDAGGSTYCRASGYVASEVGFEVVLPTTNWNHKLIALGCGAFCGGTGDIAACPLAQGFACVATDTGHRSNFLDALWASDSFRAKLDWGYLAPHRAAMVAKAIVERYFGSPPARSYFLGASNGGRQALIEAQRFPGDFDGVVAVAPAVDISRTFLGLAWGFQVSHGADGSPLLGDRELKLLTNAALVQCDLDDGVKDQIIGDPLHCRFDPGELRCRYDADDNCLSAAQVAAAQKIYQGPTTSSARPLTRGGPLAGSEFADEANQGLGWKAAYLGEVDRPGPGVKIATNGLCHLFFQSCDAAQWTLSQFHFDQDDKRLDVMRPVYDASNPDLRRFRDAGGKLIIVQGMSDSIVTPSEVIDYYQTLQRTMGGPQATNAFARLFLLPGVDHVRGRGANAIDLVGAIDAWVERSSPPDRLVAARVKDSFREHQQMFQFPAERRWIQFTRPVFPYPLRVRYQGQGDVADAANFGPVP